MARQKSAPSASIKGIFDVVRSFATALLLAILIRSFVVEPFRIPSGSMIPTLLVGDFLFVSKYTYGFSRFSFPFGYLVPYFSGRVMDWNTPQQGEVVVFRLPVDDKRDYIKRVIGLPGDRVKVEKGIIYVNDKPAKIKKIKEYNEIADAGGMRVHGTLYRETLPNGVSHDIIYDEPIGTCPMDDFPECTVPQGHLFMMGDHRDRSMDSRYLHRIGFIPLPYVVGKAQLIFLSTDDTAHWWAFWNWIPSLRLSNFFAWIR